MDKSSNIDSSIAEEENIIGANLQLQACDIPQRRNKYANMKDIKNFERLSDSHNQKLVENHPTLFKFDANKNPPVHFICTQREEYLFDSDGKKENASDTVLKMQGFWKIRIPISNIHRQTVLKVQLARMKSNRTFTLQNRTLRNQKPIRFKYTLTLLQGNLVLRVWVQLDGTYKIWKQMQVPMTQDKVLLQFKEFNSEQTDVRVNDYIFHLILRMPYESESQYAIIYDDTAAIEQIQLNTLGYGKSIDDTETNCSNECQLI